MHLVPRTSLPLTIPALAIAALVAANGCHRSAAAEPRDAAPMTTADAGADRAITAHVKDALGQDPATRSLRIGVETRDAAVTLSGEVEEDEQVARAVEVARGVTGVRDVVNRLTVKGENKAERSNTG